MPALTEEQIRGLLATQNKPRTRTPAQAQPKSPHERPVQIGPLRYIEEMDRCSSKGCASPCMIKVKGVPYCSSHALYVLNEICMKLDGTWDNLHMNDCVCNAGRHSKNNMHTADCSVYQAVKAEQTHDSTSSSVNTT